MFQNLSWLFFYDALQRLFSKQYLQCLPRMYASIMETAVFGSKISADLFTGPVDGEI
jgi:hypothetical protein